MKAVVIHEFGPPDVLTYETVPDPVPRFGEVRVRVHAATVNRVLDVHTAPTDALSRELLLDADAWARATARDVIDHR